VWLSAIYVVGDLRYQTAQPERISLRQRTRLTIVILDCYLLAYCLVVLYAGLLTRQWLYVRQVQCGFLLTLLLFCYDYQFQRASRVFEMKIPFG
jgi:uncharacterized membrane protein YbjE (DUF340 family)